MAKREDKGLLFEIDGFEVYKDSFYVSKDKVDYNAPDGFQSIGTTKLPHDGVGNSFQCPFRKTDNRGGGVWDTGFYEHSPCYRNLDKDKIRIKVKALNENIVEPYESFGGKKDILSHTNDEFWDKKSFMVQSDQVYNTNEPSDVLSLYMGLRQRELTPKNKKGDSKYKDSAYFIIDQTKEVAYKDEKAAEKYKAIGIFHQMLQDDKSTLISILGYIGVTVSEESEDIALIGLFEDYISGDKGPSKIELFNRIAKEASTDDGKAKLIIHSKLRSDRSLIEKVGNFYYWQDFELGPDLKTAAESISKRSDLSNLKDEILLGD